MNRYACRKVFFVLMSLGTLLCVNRNCPAEITETSPLLRNIYRVRGVDNTDVVYAGTDGGILKSSDNCVSWELLPVPGAGGKRMRMEVVRGIPVARVAGGIFIIDNKTEELSFVDLSRDMRVIGEKRRDMESDADMFLFDRVFLYALRGRDVGRIGSLPGKRTVHNVILTGGLFFAFSGKELFVSTDKGLSWKKIMMVRRVAGEEDESPQEDENAMNTERGAGMLRSSGAGKVTLLTASGIHMLDASGVYRSVPTTGLPSAEVKSAIYRKGELLASTGKEVFRYSFDDEEWRFFCAPSGSGDIVDMDIYRTSDGGYRFILAMADNIFCMPLHGRVAEKYGKESVKCRRWPVMPPIAEVQRMAVDYAEVAPEKIRRWRRGARWKALLPRLSVTYSESMDDNIDIYKNSSTSYVVRGPRERDNDWSVDMTWDLSDLIWNSEQTSIDVRSKLMVQLREDILEEVTRLYFRRKKLVIEMMDEGVDSERALRVREVTAYIDALTGGAFSEAMAAAGEE